MPVLANVATVLPVTAIVTLLLEAIETLLVPLEILFPLPADIPVNNAPFPKI